MTTITKKHTLLVTVDGVAVESGETLLKQIASPGYNTAKPLPVQRLIELGDKYDASIGLPTKVPSGLEKEPRLANFFAVNAGKFFVIEVPSLIVAENLKAELKHLSWINTVHVIPNNLTPLEAIYWKSWAVLSHEASYGTPQQRAIGGFQYLERCVREGKKLIL